MAYYYSKYGASRRKKSKFQKFVFRFLLLLIVLAFGAGYWLYSVIYKTNTWTPNGKQVSIYLPSDANFDTLKFKLYKNGLIIHRKNFEWWAQQKKLTKLIKPERYTPTCGKSIETN